MAGLSGMPAYNAAAFAAARGVMQTYSTSFGIATRLFNPAIRQDINNIYAMVRVADEIVDTYKGPDALALLDEFEQVVLAAQKRAYSTNLIAHAYALTAQKYSIDVLLVTAFFASMRMDVKAPKKYTAELYNTYIYGSAQVVGLMCLRIFCDGDEQLYLHLRPGAEALGAGFQKVNFLRDMGADHADLHRYYFPLDTFETFNESTKLSIIKDITADFMEARGAISQLPSNSQPAVMAAYKYYYALLNKLGNTPANTIKYQRVRIPNVQKVAVLVGASASHRLKNTIRRRA